MNDLLDCKNTYLEISRIPVFASESHKVTDVTKLFEKNLETTVVVIMDETIICGIVVRAHLYRQLGHRLGNDLFSNRPITYLMDKNYLVINEKEPLHVVVKKAMMRNEENLYDPILVKTTQGIRTLSIRALLLKINEYQRDSMLAQADKLVDTVTNANDLNYSFQTVGEKISEHVNKFEELIEITEENKTKFAKIDTIYTNVTNISKTQGSLSLSLHNQGEELLNYVDNILSLAERTNILSLNASIESARAGLHGKGFAVVAEEIRKLAGNTSVVSNEIKERIVTIFNMIKNNSSTTIEGLKEIEEVRKVIESTEESFNKLAIEINKSNLEMEQVNTMSQDASLQAENLSTVLQELYESTKENALSLVIEESIVYEVIDY